MSSAIDPVSSGPRSRRTGRPWPRWLLGVPLLAVGVALACWHFASGLASPRPTLPALPDGAGRPAELVERLTRAHAAAQTAPSSTTVAELARLYHANGYSAQAAACWRWLEAAQPDVARWPYYQADLRRAESDYEAMEPLLRRTVTLAPDYAPAWLQLAAMAFKRGQLDQAERDYRRRLELIPGDPYARLGLARVAQQQGQSAAARSGIEAIVRERPDFAPAQNLWAEMLAAAGDTAGATRHRWLGREAGRYREDADPWTEELTAWCFDPERLRLLANIEYQTGRGDRGRAWLERAVALAPEDPAGRQLLGELYLKLGEAALAREAFQEIIRRAMPRPASVLVYVHLVDAHRMLRDAPAALETIDTAVAALGETFELHNARGAVMGDLGRVREAAAAYARGVALAPSDVDSRLNLGAALLALGERQEGEAHVQRVLELRPSHPQALALLGRLALEEDRLDQAENYLRLLYEAHPGQERARGLLAQWHLRSGRVAEKHSDTASAERHYRAGLELAPDDAELNASLGVLCLLSGRVNEALAPLENHRRLKPQDPRAALFLGQAYARLARLADARRVLTEGEQLAVQAGNETTASYCREILQQLPR